MCHINNKNPDITETKLHKSLGLTKVSPVDAPAVAGEGQRGGKDRAPPHNRSVQSVHEGTVHLWSSLALALAPCSARGREAHPPCGWVKSDGDGGSDVLHQERGGVPPVRGGHVHDVVVPAAPVEVLGDPVHGQGDHHLVAEQVTVLGQCGRAAQSHCGDGGQGGVYQVEKTLLHGHVHCNGLS